MRKLLLAYVAQALFACITIASARAESFPGFTWKEMQDGQGLTGPGYANSRRPPFEEALKGKPLAVAAFFDTALTVDGEYSFKFGRMNLLMLASLGDKAFSKQLSQRSPWVQWSTSLLLSMRLQEYDYRVSNRFPQTLSLLHRWQAIPSKEMRRAYPSELPIYLRP